jgi:hypothetical protein
MRKLIVTSVGLAVASLTGVLLSTHAQAMTIRLSHAGMPPKASPIEDVAYRCQKVWRCGYGGCAWERECRRRAPRYNRPYNWDYPADWQAYHFIWQ